MLNALAIVNNPYQGDAKRVVCCCSAGLLRSPTAAAVLSREFGYNTRSVGLEDSYALVPLNKALIAWAHEFVVMTPQHELVLLDKLGKRKKPIVVLDIPDNFAYNDPRLIELIKESYVSKRPAEESA